ncbi:class I SAM-dependent methyltransferase [Actinopolymorpha alba]|uniref:class I SAM-dependent methyltransferase n=1 Tax=Actinopolymorpha alba TaxID=533267 RepID=UPI00037F1D15|nr:class I SAM-dependent methyltransferase [Actinopolymorpha alba]
MTDPERTLTGTEHSPPRSWYIDRPLTGFALPRGRVGSLLGRLMGMVNKSEQLEVLAAVDVQPGERVLEAGYGPGVLLGMLLGAGATVAGVDPSPEMRALAARRSEKAVAAGTADLRVGTAESTGFPDESFDVAVSVNNVPMWSDLTAGMRELHRVVRPGGRVVVAWHGGTHTRGIARKLVLPADVLDRITVSMRDVFGNGEMRQGRHIVTFQATR